MTGEEFADGYAKRSGVTAQWLKEHGRGPRPCDCGERGCEGWQMTLVREEEWFRKAMSGDKGEAAPASAEGQAKLAPDTTATFAPNL